MPPTDAPKTPAWEVILYAVLAVAPLLFGAVYPWAYGLMEIAVITALGLFLWHGPKPAGRPRALWGWGLACLAGLVFLAGLQMLPLPPVVVKFLAPSSYAMWQPVSLTTAQGQAHALLPLSLYPFATAGQGLLMLTYTAVVVLAAQITRAKAAAQAGWPLSFCLLVLVGFVVATAGILQLGLDSKAIYGFFAPHNSHEFLGPFVNYNHFAGYLAMVVPLGLGLMASGIFISLQSRHKKYNQVFLVGFALVIMLAGVFLSRSRGGIITLLLVMGLQLSLVVVIGKAWKIKRSLAALGLCVVLLLGVSTQITDWSRTLPRFHMLFHQKPTDNLRWKLYADVLRMGNQLPLTGSGLGTFAVAYPAFKTLDRQGLFDHAHNDYLEFLAEMGWPGLLLFLGFTAWVLWRGGRVILLALARRTRGDPALAQRALLITGSLGGVMALLLHGLTDFNLRIPANALTWFALCGVTLGLGDWDQERPGE